MSLYGRTFDRGDDDEEQQNKKPNGGSNLYGQTFNPKFVAKAKESKPLEVKSSKPIIAPIPSATQFQMRPSHEPIIEPKKASTWEQIKAGDIKGLAKQVGIGLSQGISKLGSAKQDVEFAKIMADSTLPRIAERGKQKRGEIQANQDYLKANPVDSLPAMLGEELTRIPLWMAGEGAVGLAGKGLSKLSPRLGAIGEKVGSKVPDFIKGGLKDAAAYGSVVAPTQNIQEGGSFQDLLEKEKQLPMIALGGVAARGAFKGVGKGIEKTKSAIKPLGVPPAPFGPPRPTSSVQRRSGLGPLKTNDTIPLEDGLGLASSIRKASMEANPLDDVRNAYKAPSIRDVKTQKYNELFSSDAKPLATEQRINIRQPLASQGMTDAELLAQRKSAAQDVFGDPLKTFKKNTDTQNTIEELSAQMDNQLKGIETMIRQADEQTPIGTIRKKIKDMGGIKQADDGIFEERKVIPNWIRNDKGGRPLDEVADTLGMNSDELLVAISDSAYKPRNYAAEAQALANKDAEYLALGNTLEMLKGELSGKRTLDSLKNKSIPVNGSPQTELIPYAPKPQKPLADSYDGYQKLIDDADDVLISKYGVDDWLKMAQGLESKITKSEVSSYNSLVDVRNKIWEAEKAGNIKNVSDGVDFGKYDKGKEWVADKQSVDNALKELQDDANWYSINKEEYNPTVEQIKESLYNKLIQSTDAPEQLWGEYRLARELASDFNNSPLGKSTKPLMQQIDEIVESMLNPREEVKLLGSVKTENPIKPLTKSDIRLKPRELKGPQKIESIPTERILPKQEPLTWTNREGLGPSSSPAPIRPIAEQGGLPNGRIANSVRQEPIRPIEATTDIDIPVVGGRADLSNVLEIPRTRTMNAMIESPNTTLSSSPLRSPAPIRPQIPAELPAPQSDIVIGRPKEPFSFKKAWEKFYTGVVDTTSPTGKVDETLRMKALNTKNVGGIVDYNFLKGMVDKSGNKIGESFKSTVEAVPKGKEKEFWSYMSQRHNIDRAREGKHVQANYTPEMSADAVKIAEQANPEYKAIGDGIVKWIDEFMQTWGVDTGIVNKELYGNLRQTYKSYFPTQRDFSELEKAIPDNVSRKFADQRTPIRKATGSERDIIDPVENIMNLVDRTIRTAKYNEVGQSLLGSVRQAPEKLKPLAEVIQIKDGMFSNKDNIITVLEDGKPIYLQINDKRFLDAINGLPKSIGEIPVLSTLTNGFKQLITQSNPIFAVRNIFRDIPTAYVYGSEANPFKFGAGIIGAGKDIVTNSPRLQKYQAVGGGGANFFSAGDITKSAAELTGKINPIKKVVSAPIKAIQKFNNLTETAPRLAEFNRVLAKTGDVNKALFAANDVSVNFSRGGNITKNVDKVVPYLNAGVQGLDKFFRGFKDPKTAIQTIVKSGVAITTPTIALYLVNKDNPNYQALDNRTKDAYYLVPKENGTFFKIPKSRELGVLFSSLLQRGLRQAEGQENSFKGFGNTVATNFSPANPIDSNFFAPALEIIGKGDNKDFANRPIIPQAMLMDKRSDYLQYDEKTTTIAKAIGEMTKGMPGNEDGISPKQLDYFIKSYSGVIGQFGIPLATPGGSPKKALTSQFVADPTFSNQSTTDFYDKLDKLSASAVDKNITQKIPSKKLTPEEDMRNSMNAISSSISKGTKTINSIQASEDPLKEKKIKIIKEQQLQLMRKGVLANTPKIMQKVETEAKKIFK